MNRYLQRALVAALRPPLVAIRFLGSPLYNFIFAPFDRASATRNQRNLKKDIRDTLPFLFTEYQAKVAENTGIPFPPPFDYAVVTLSLGDVLLRFIRGRDELDIRVAHVSEPGKWHELMAVFNAIGIEDIKAVTFSYLGGAALVLKQYLGKIQESFSPARLSETRKEILRTEDYMRTVARQLETEINRNLYG